MATLQLPLPLLDVLADTRTAFFGLCLEAGQQVLHAMMEQDREATLWAEARAQPHAPGSARREYA